MKLLNCQHQLALLYKLVPKKFRSDAYFNTLFGEFAEIRPTSDDERNAQLIFKRFFEDGCGAYVLAIFDNILFEMQSLEMEDCDKLFDAVSALQIIVGQAVWKYRCNVGDELQSFVRDYDRIDEESVRLNLHKVAKNRDFGGIH